MECKKMKELQIQIIDGDRGKNYPNGDDFKKEKYCLFLNAKNVKDNGFDFTETMFINKEKDELLRKGKLERNDIVLTTRGTVGNVAYYSNNIEYQNIRINSGMVILRCDNDIIYSKYLYYVLKSKSVREQINQIKTGSAQPQLPISVLKEIELKWIDLNEQKKIVKILEDIDKKIELNNQMNCNLQELVRCIYNTKFKYKHNNGKLKDILDLCRKNIKNKNENLKYFPVDVLPMNYLITREGKPNEEAQSSLIEFKKYDILIGAMRVYFHRVCLAAEDGITRTTMFVLRPKSCNYLYYSLITLDKDEFIKYASDGSKGSTMPYAVWEGNCNEYDIYVPTETEAKEFNELVTPLFEIQINLEKNNRVLEKLRDTLLPKLMNGEIDLDKIEI